MGNEKKVYGPQLDESKTARVTCAGCGNDYCMPWDKMNMLKSKCPFCGALNKRKLTTAERIVTAAMIATIPLAIIFFVRVFSGSYEGREELNARFGAVAAIKEGLIDPESFDIIREDSRKTKDGTYYVKIRYRAKNMFGGYVVDEKALIVTKDGVVVDYY